MNGPFDSGSNSQSASLGASEDCGCCEGKQIKTPAEIFNPAKQGTIAYRAGTHTAFLESMKVRLSDAELPALRGLTTRDDSSFSIGLLDGWATIADVLTFYQERIANESYLRTAREDKSLFELGRFIGYTRKPGVAASTHLAFTLDEAPGSPLQITIDTGTKAQSVPGPDEKPQLYETTEKIVARVEWNTIRPRLAQPQQLSTQLDAVVVHGTNPSLKPGDCLLIHTPAGDRFLSTVMAVTSDHETTTTCLDLSTAAAASKKNVSPPRKRGDVREFLNKPINEAAYLELAMKDWREEDLQAIAQVNGWPMETLIAQIAAAKPTNQSNGKVGVYAFRQRTALFGYNAPKPRQNEGALDPPESSHDMFLDSAYAGILPTSDLAPSYVAVQKPGANDKILEVTKASVHPRTAYGLSSRTTHLTLSESWWDLLPQLPTLQDLRDVTVHAQSERLALAGVALEETTAKDQPLELDGLYLGLRPGRKVILTGQRTGPGGIVASELLVVKEVLIKSGYTELTFEGKLQHCYLRKTVVLNANVALATHGETVQEVLGSGDPGQRRQQFKLQQNPVTHVSAATPAGAESTLEVRVNEIQWHEIGSLLSAQPDDRVFATCPDYAGGMTIEFGDGKNGARLPAGADNVRAQYRKGIGAAGQAKAGQITQLMTRPLGLKAVSNPLPAVGGVDGQGLEELRRSVPLTLLTLGRVVSLKDYEDFAKGFPGIAKALAVSKWVGQTHHVLITVAGPKGTAITTDSNTYRQLSLALQAAGHPDVVAHVKSYVSTRFSVAATVTAEPDYLPLDVLAAVKKELSAQFSFGRRAFGQGVSPSEVIAAMQSVSGVASARLDDLRIDRRPGLLTQPPKLDDWPPADLLTLEEASLAKVELPR